MLLETKSNNPLLANTQRDLYLLALGLFLFFYIFGAYCFRDFLNADELDDYWYIKHSLYVANGRWAIAAYHFIFDAESTPFTAGISSALFLSVALVKTCRILNWSDTWSRIIFFVAALGSAQFASQLIFSYQAPVVALGMLAAVYAYSFAKSYIEQKSLWSLGISVALLVFAMGCYQTLSMIFVVMFCGDYLLNQVHLPTSRAWGVIGKVVSVFVLACVVYFFFTTAAKQLLLSEADIEGIDGYQKSFFKWGDIPVGESVKCVLLEYARKIFGFPLRENWLYGLTILPVCLWGVRIFRCSFSKSGTARSVLFLMLLVIWLFPFSVSLIIGNQAPERLYVAQTWSCGWLYASVWPFVAPVLAGRKVKFCLPVMAFAVLVMTSASNSASKYVIQHEIHWERSAHTMHRVENMLAASGLLNELVPEEGKIYICGMNDKLYEGRHSSALDGAFFEDQARWAMPIYSHHHVSRTYMMASDARLQQWESVLSQMPAWPNPQCMRVHDGNIIIKMGNLPPKSSFFQ